jgi:hypothetical protein
MQDKTDFEGIASITDTALRANPLTSVVFVMDYLQLVFDESRFNLTRWPRVVHGDKTLKLNDPGYRDAICNLIGQRVSKAYFSNNNKTFAVEFDNRTLIEMPLDDFTSPYTESVLFHHDDNHWWVL